jgi:hypothetical protein
VITDSGDPDHGVHDAWKERRGQHDVVALHVIAQPAFTPDERSVVGGIIKRIVASQVRPCFRCNAMDYAHIVAP